MSITKETQARITTQLALRDTANLLENTKNRTENELDNKARKLKRTRSNVAKLNEEMIDIQLKGAIVLKSRINERKTTKYPTIQWLYLNYDEDKPFTRREEHLIPIACCKMFTKKPEKVIQFLLGIYVTRHFLERVALRDNVVTLEDMVAVLAHPIVALNSEYMVNKCSDYNGIVYISKDEYVVIDPIGEHESIMKTYMPKSEWSHKRKMKLKSLLDQIDNNQSVFVSQDDFNSKENLESYCI